MKYPTYSCYVESDIEWIGKIPATWTKKRFKYLFRSKSGGTPDTEVPEYWEGDVPWVSAKDMRSLRMEDTEDHISSRAVAASATTLIPAGTLLLLTRSGILRHSLPVSVSVKEMAINQDVKACIPLKSVNPRYFAFTINALQRQLLTLWRQQGATVESLDFDAVKATYFVLPPFDEQCAIVDFLDEATKKIDMLTRILASVCVQEYRTALITAAVTGKIDVRARVPKRKSRPRF